MKLTRIGVDIAKQRFQLVATALIATIGDAKQFANGHQMAASPGCRANIAPMARSACSTSASVATRTCTAC